MCYRRIESGLDGDKNANWIDACEEIAQILDISLKNNLTPEEIGNAILASVFWRSVQSAPGKRFDKRPIRAT
jgi:hypothetical protein